MEERTVSYLADYASGFHPGYVKKECFSDAEDRVSITEISLIIMSCVVSLTVNLLSREVCKKCIAWLPDDALHM